MFKNYSSLSLIDDFILLFENESSSILAYFLRIASPYTTYLVLLSI
jgi:hypothetical protein